MYRLFLEQSKFEQSANAPEILYPLEESIVDLNFILYRLRRKQVNHHHYERLFNHYISIIFSIDQVFFHNLPWYHQTLLIFSFYDNARHIKDIHNLPDILSLFSIPNDPLLIELFAIFSGQFSHIVQRFKTLRTKRFFRLFCIGFNVNASGMNSVDKGFRVRLSKFVDTLIDRIKKEPSPQLTILVLNSLSDWKTDFACIVQ